MQNEMSSYINHFKKRVDERTREIEEQKNIITEQKQNLIDSINSAKMIQHSMLQDEHHISHIAPGCFVLYLPKDIVSGDFYYVDWKWDEQSMSETLYLLVGDATGHGVPGAFTSMLGLSIIKSLFEKTISPLELMITLNNVLYHHLHKNKKKKSLENFENMDIGLCCIDYKAMTLRFISANRPCYIIRQGQLLEIKRTFVGIGEDLNVEHKLCVKELDLQEGDTIYIFSDGYASQFGENENKKLNTKRFVEIITRASELDLPKQKSFLETSLRNWQHGTEQTDDIVLLGLKITRQT
jgi:serine phosphatase RsbU (regulator of sigma subunit)